MKLIPVAVVTPLAILALSLAGCAAAAPVDDGSRGPADQPITSGGSDGASQFGATGGAIVELDGESFEYGGLGCELDYLASDGKTYAWGAGKMRTIDEKAINFSFGAFDPSGQGRVSGDGVSYNIVMMGYGFPRASSIEVNANATSGVVIAGDPTNVSENTLKVSGSFVDDSGTTFSVTIDAQCASSEH